MSDDERVYVTVDVDGMSVDEATATVREAGATGHPESIRTALAAVAEDGVVSRSAAEEALSEASLTVSTAENRRDVAASHLSDAREAAEPVADLEAVAARLAAFEEDLAAVEDAVDDLGDRLDRLADLTGDPEALYPLGVGVQEVTARATELQRRADALRDDVESFERWLDDPAVRVEEFRTDLEAVETTLDDLTGRVETLTGQADDAVESDADTDALDDADLGALWIEGTLRTRVLALLLADLRAELSDLRDWPDDGATLADLGDRVDEFAARRDRLADRLDDLARPEWRDRYADRIEGLEAELDGMEPPVDWAAVHEAFEANHPAVDTQR
ncbi:MAG: halo transducer protein [Haloarculaceae archaeon]